MSLHVAQFRALALKNLSLQLQRKGSTCCQLFIPISIALTVGLLQAFAGGGGSNDYWHNGGTYWSNPGIPQGTGQWMNISYTSPTVPSSLPVGNLSQYGNVTTGVIGMGPQYNYTEYIQYPYRYANIYTPFLGKEFSSPDEIDQYFYDRQLEVQSCRGNYYRCGQSTKNTTTAFLIRNLEASPQINLDFTVQTGDPYLLNNLGLYGSDPKLQFGFFTSFIHNSMLRYFFNDTASLIVTGFSSMPYKEYNNPGVVGSLFSLFMIPFAASFLFSVYMYTLVQEKKEGLVQKMHACGLPMSTYWVVNYIYNYLLFLLIATVLFAFGLGFGVQVFVKKPAEMAVLLFLYGHAQVAMCQLFTCFLWAPTLASIVGFILSIFGTLGGLALEVFVFLQHPREMPNGWFMLYPGFAFYHGFGLLVYEMLDVNFGSVTLNPGTHFSNILLILIAETIVFFLLTWYVEAIFPREFGVRRSPLFPIKALIEKIKKSRGSDYEVLLKRYSERDSLLESKDIRSDLPEPSGDIDEDEDVAREREMARTSDAMVRVIELTKIYPGSNGKEPKLALNHVSLRIQANECFGLLGPNGAGKTTLLSTLCGTIAPTSGVAFIDGLSIKENMEDIHKIIGICPQFDVLWSELTVTDHLLFYLRLKGAAGNEREQVKNIIEEVGLEEVTNRSATGLSGGQKRRLSIAIAMMGRPKLILMDEPTTGLDPSSRRALWDIIVKAKERHSIILSTHSMEEAEVLCNRIGIMRKAQLHSVGTQMHLKNKFELGFNVKVSHFLNCEEKAHNFVMECIPNAVLVRAFGGIRAYKVMKGDFLLSDLFKKMELNKYRYGIKEWSISQASLEEVFLAIVTEDESDEK
eukprot:Phypoly_transcript_02580.p1 GENE.Phypoly_transcript_02580~~Phypoly_transcript_02580.p1  ORF type:complete len:904 (+),score=109.04 Phypoly_transcript_02580:144-2714(+)